VEIQIHQLFNKLIDHKRTPHINKLINFFDIDAKVISNDLQNNRAIPDDDVLFQNIIKKYKNGIYDNIKASVMITEYSNRKDLLSFLIKKCNRLQIIHWKILLFQIISTLCVIRSNFPTFRHNCLCLRNILVNKTTKNNKNNLYKVMKKKFTVPNIGCSIKLNDFDFASIDDSVENDKIRSEYVSDIVDLFNNFIKLNEYLKIPQTICAFFERNMKCSDLFHIISTDSLFSEFRCS